MVDVGQAFEGTVWDGEMVYPGCFVDFCLSCKFYCFAHPDIHTIST
jgi:hypothetical protein